MTDIAATSASSDISTEGAAPPVSKTTNSTNLRVDAAADAPSTNGSSNGNKENTANAALVEPTSLDESSSSSPSLLKRPATSTSSEFDTKHAKADASTADCVKRAKTSPKNDDDNDENNNGAPLDLAVTIGYNPGDRIEVQWEVETDDGDIVVKWWGATLKTFDGRTTDSVAIRTLHYDACPELGFSEPNDEDVVFLGPDLLVSPDATTQLQYRREGEEEDVLWLNEDEMDEQLNAILMGALAKNQGAWQKLPAAQQAMIADKIKNQKEVLLKVLKSKKEIITSSSIKDILKETFGRATPSKA